MKTVLTITKKWHQPTFTYRIASEDMSAEVDLDDFIKALKAEIGSVTWTLKQASFEKQLDQAVADVLSGIKAESKKVV